MQDQSLRQGESLSEALERFRRVSERFFHKDEQAYIFDDADKETAEDAKTAETAKTAEGQLARFFRIWTAKESYVKLSGTGINDDFGKFSVLSVTDADFDFYQVKEGFLLCLCRKK